MIFFDTNEASKRAKDGSLITGDVIDFIREVGEVDVQKTPLITGDAMFWAYSDITGSFTRSIGMEFKVYPSDFLSSIGDGRLMRQLPGMVREYDLPYLVLINHPIEVNFTTGKVLQRRGRTVDDSPYSYHLVNNLLLKFEAAGGSVRHVPDLDQLAAFLLSSYQYHRKSDHHIETWTRKRTTEFREWNQLSNPVAEIYERCVDEDGRGIGIKRALRLAEEFPKPQMLRGVGWRRVANLKLDNGKRFGPVNAKKVEQWLS